MGLLDDIAEKLERDVSLQTTSSFAKPGTPVRRAQARNGQEEGGNDEMREE